MKDRTLDFYTKSPEKAIEAINQNIKEGFLVDSIVVDNVNEVDVEANILMDFTYNMERNNIHALDNWNTYHKTVFKQGCFKDYGIDFGFRCVKDEWNKNGKGKGYTRTIEEAELEFIAIIDKNGKELKRIDISELLQDESTT